MRELMNEAICKTLSRTLLTGPTALAPMIVLLFLGNFRSTLIAALAIPDRMVLIPRLDPASAHQHLFQLVVRPQL